MDNKLPEQIKDVVVFKSLSFNTTQEMDYFINPGLFGDDLGSWLIEEFHKRGIKTSDEPQQEDWGWFIDADLDSTNKLQYSLRIYRTEEPGSDGDWIIYLDFSDKGNGFKEFFSSLFKNQQQAISKESRETINSILLASEHVQEIEWYSSKTYKHGIRASDQET